MVSRIPGLSAEYQFWGTLALFFGLILTTDDVRKIVAILPLPTRGPGK